MPITKSAKKRLRQNEKRRKTNKIFKDNLKEVIKTIRELVAKDKIKKAEEKLPETYKAIDKAAKKGVIKEKTANRKKSRITALIKKAKNKQ